MAMSREKEDKRLGDLTINAKICMDTLKGYQKLGEKILKTAELCRKLETEKEKEQRLQDEKDDITVLINRNVDQLCADSLTTLDFQDEHKKRIRCLEIMERRLHYILFLREFNVICCLREKKEDEGHLSFNEILEASCRGIQAGKRVEKRLYETAKKAAKMERVRNQLN